MYLGEARIYQDNLHTILEIARDLQFEELTQEFEPVEETLEEEITRTADDEDLAYYGNESNTNIEDKHIMNENNYEHDSLTTSKTTEILKLYIPNNPSANDELLLEKPSYKCKECDSIFKSKTGLQLKEA